MLQKSKCIFKRSLNLRPAGGMTKGRRLITGGRPKKMSRSPRAIVHQQHDSIEGGEGRHLTMTNILPTKGDIMHYEMRSLAELVN